MASRGHIKGFINELRTKKTALVEEISAAVVSDVAMAAADTATRIANSNGLFEGVDGNRLTKIYCRQEGDKASVVAVGPIKPGSRFSDATYLEYGYGPVAIETGNPLVTAVDGMEYPPGYTPTETGVSGSSGSANGQPWHDPKYEEAGGWYYNNLIAGDVSFSRGIAGFAYMGTAKELAVKDFPKELRKKHGGKLSTGIFARMNKKRISEIVKGGIKLRTKGKS